MIVKTQTTNPKSHWKTNKGLCGLVNFGNSNSFNAVFQILLNTPSIKTFYKKIFGIYSENINSNPENLPKSLNKR